MKSSRSTRRTRAATPDLRRSLAIVERLVRGLSGSFDTGSIGDRVIGVLTKELGLHSCSIMLVESSGRRLVNLSGASAGGRATDHRSFAIGEGIAGMVALHGAAIRVDDARDDHRFIDRPSAVRSLLCFPLLSGERVIGVLNLSHPDPGFFTRDHESVFSVAATMVGHLLTFAGLQAELAEWNRSLEAKVEAKTKEIETAQQHAFQREKLASLGTLVAGVAHELNNKLVPLLAYSHVLAGTPRSDEERRLVTAMASAAVGAKHIVEGLLRFARQDPPAMGLVDCNDVVREVTDLLPLQQHRSGITLRTTLAQDLPPVRGDARQLGQVLVNLINNACDAMGEAGTLGIVTRANGGAVEMEVTDTGSGVPPDVVSKIFDPFFTTKEVGRGTGLGLSLCYGMIRSHHGDIAVDSRPGRTVFTVSVPVAGRSGSPSQEPGRA
ncbi:MAG: ATP-binding protein [Nitrospiria bacterium]